MDNKVLLALLGAIIATGLFIGYFATVSSAPLGGGVCEPMDGVSTVDNNTAANGQNASSDESADTLLPENIDENTTSSDAINDSSAAGEAADNSRTAEDEDIESQVEEASASTAGNGSSWNGTGVILGKIKDLQISASADKTTYYSHELMNLTVNMSIDNMLPGFLKAQGLKNKFGAYKFKKSERVNLASGENTYSWSYSIPACYSCSGISPGKYSIDVWFDDGSGSKSEVSTIKIEIKSEDEE